jgi:hypothetical protein
MPAGRPSKYSDETCRKARLYVDGGYAELGDVVPQIAGLACVIGINRDTVYEWASDPEKKEFSDIVAGCLSTQERKLVNGSLKGELNPTITKLLLTKHGYTERIQQELTGADGGAIKTDNKWTIEVVK